MKKYIINMLVAITFATTTQAQVPVITTQPNNANVCKGSTATFNVAANNNPIGYGWEYSNNGGETFVQINSNSVNGFQFSNFNTANIGVLNGTNGFMLRGYAYNASGGSQPSSVAMLTINTATDSLYIVKPNTTPTCVGKSFLLAGSQANGVFSSSNSNVATVNCSGMVNVKAQGTSNINYVYTGTNGCVSTATYSINATQATIPTITGIATLCIGANAALTNSLTGGKWSSLNNRANINLSGVVTGASNGSASIKYTATDADGCVGSTTKTIAVVSLPNVPTIQYAAGTANPQVGAGGAFCTNRTFTVVGTPSGGVWSSTGVLLVNTISGLANTGSNAGAGSLTYTYTNSNGCSNSRTIVGNIVVCASRGVNGIEKGKVNVENEFTIYPNPAKSFISLQINELIGAGSIVITDLYGKEVKSCALSLGNNIVNIASFAKGFYLVNVITTEGRTTKKLIVE